MTASPGRINESGYQPGARQALLGGCSRPALRGALDRIVPALVTACVLVAVGLYVVHGVLR